MLFDTWQDLLRVAVTAALAYAAIVLILRMTGKRTLANAADAAEEVKAAAKDARSMISKLEGPTTEFATTGLPQLTQAIIEIQSAAESLERLTNEIQQNPRGLIGKAPSKEVEVQP